ncbi:MAG: hypothetical protein OXF11_22255 [Deltaproteobacteria bacterium]|nr:hypothetical protein [Deltaproteobacteria bacterium]
MNALYATAIVTLLTAGQAANAICGTTFSGTAVEFRTGTKIKGVTVQIKDARSGNILGSDTTNGSGSYDISTDKEPERISVTYDPPKRSKWEAAGRSRLLRVGPNFVLDTAGLTNKQSGKKDGAEREQHARNTAGYTRAGGDKKVVQESFKRAIARFGRAYQEDARRTGLLQALKTRKINFR